jgi:hypothetical protein
MLHTNDSGLSLFIVGEYNSEIITKMSTNNGDKDVSGIVTEEKG